MNYRSESHSPTVAAIIVFVALAIVYSIYWHSEQSTACERRGGVYFCPYKSSCLCLAKGVVLQ